MNETFIAQIERYRQKTFTVALAFPEPYRQEMRSLICRLMEKGASYRTKKSIATLGQASRGKPSGIGISGSLCNEATNVA